MPEDRKKTGRNCCDLAPHRRAILLPAQHTRHSLPYLHGSQEGLDCIPTMKRSQESWEVLLGHLHTCHIVLIICVGGGRCILPVHCSTMEGPTHCLIPHTTTSPATVRCEQTRCVVCHLEGRVSSCDGKGCGEGCQCHTLSVPQASYLSLENMPNSSIVIVSLPSSLDKQQASMACQATFFLYKENFPKLHFIRQLSFVNTPCLLYGV